MSTFSALTTQGNGDAMSLDFPLPSALGPEVRNPTTFGLHHSTSYSSPQTAIQHGLSSHPYGGVYGYGYGYTTHPILPNHTNGLPPTLPPLRLPDRPSLSNPPSSISTSSFGYFGTTATTASSPRYYGQTGNSPCGDGGGGGGLQQPPPHTCPPHTHSHSHSSSGASEHLYTPTTGYSMASYLTPPGSGQLPPLTSGSSMTLPGVGSILPPPPPQLHLPSGPTTVEPKAIQDPRFRSSYGYLTEPCLRGSSSTLSLFDSISRHSVSPMSASANGNRYSISRSTSVSVESEPEPEQHGHGNGSDKPKLREFEPYYPTELGGISKMDIERMKFEGMGKYAGEIYYTDDWETKQSATVCPTLILVLVLHHTTQPSSFRHVDLHAWSSEEGTDDRGRSRENAIIAIIDPRQVGARVFSAKERS